jgi:hypothetical protein
MRDPQFRGVKKPQTLRFARDDKSCSFSYSLKTTIRSAFNEMT